VEHPKAIGDRTTLAVMLAQSPSITTQARSTIGVHCPATGGVYLIPIGDVPRTRVAALRVEPARNCQRKSIRLAADYEICKVALSAGLRATAGA
jgi:hypothetical protein